MVDTAHNEQKEALEDLVNRTAFYRGLKIGSASFTSTEGYVTHDDGTITGPGFFGGFIVSQQVKALIDASLDTKAPETSPPDSDGPLPADTSAPVSQALVVDKSEIHVGDIFTISGSLNYKDGTSKSVTAYAVTVSDPSVAVQTPLNNWVRTFMALKEGTVTIMNDNSGTRGECVVVIHPNDGTAPPPASSAPSPAPSPSPSPSPSPTPGAQAGVYHEALKGLSLPLMSAWSDTRPDYSAQSTISLTNGPVITVDTDRQVPDYVPYAEVWIYPCLLDDGTRHPDITLNCYPDCVKIGNAWADASGNYAGHHTITIGGVVVQDVDSRYDFGCYTAPCREGLPQLTPSNDWDTKLTPNYGKVAGGYKSFADDLAQADNGVNGRSIVTPVNNMGATGYQLGIGVLHGATIPYIVDGGDENWQVVRKVEDHASCYPIHLRDRVTGLPAVPCIPHCADVSLEQQVGGARFDYTHYNPVKIWSKSPLKPDNAHCPGMGVVAYLATGSAHDLEELQFWAGYECYWANPTYRQYEKCISTGQVRGVAWQLRSKAYAARLTPVNHPLHDGLQSIMDANVEHFTTKYAAGAPSWNKFGIVGNESSFVHDVTGFPAAAEPPWMQDFLVSSVHQIMRMGFSGWDDFKAFLNTYTIGRMGTGGSEALWWTTANFYDHVPRKLRSGMNEGAKTNDYVDDWATFNTQNLRYGGYASEIGKTLEQADVGGGPGQPHDLSSSPTRYWPNFQPALACLPADHPAWLLYAEKVLPGIDYHSAGQFNIQPDAVSSGS